MTTWEDTKAFIKEHENWSLADVALRLSKFPELPKEHILNQINGRAKAKQKLPEFYAHEDIIYPTYLSMEQCSSELTAKYKTQLLSGDTVIDFTCGFGVDTYYFSKTFKKVIATEPNAELTDITMHNYDVLNAKNITVINATAEEYITNAPKADLIYIDPSRRVKTRKVFKLVDGVPNIVELLPKMFEIASLILVKTSPLMDITQAIEELKHVKEVHVVAINNECKELLFLLEKGYSDSAKIVAIDLLKKEEKFVINQIEETKAKALYSAPLTYLYEPNAAVLKSGAFNLISKRFNLKKIAPNSHLYTSENLVENFPGRSFKIIDTCSYNTKEFKALNIVKANITTRNFSDSVDTIKKILKLKDGGDTYIFATKTLESKPVLVISDKI